MFGHRAEKSSDGARSKPFFSYSRLAAAIEDCVHRIILVAPVFRAAPTAASTNAEPMP
jgi:hypothetical protein